MCVICFVGIERCWHLVLRYFDCHALAVWTVANGCLCPVGNLILVVAYIRQAVDGKLVVIGGIIVIWGRVA